MIGVRSPIAHELPDDAFLTRRGVRVAESGRYLLDLRSTAARAHLDQTVDRLVREFGIGFFKFDNNTMTGPGTDKRGTSLGHGLLEHQRARDTFDSLLVCSIRLAGLNGPACDQTPADQVQERVDKSFSR